MEIKQSIDIVGARGQTGTMFSETLGKVPGLVIIQSGHESFQKDLLTNQPALLIVATRNPVNEVLDVIRERTADGSTVVLTQNGVDAPELAKTYLGDRNINVISGVLVTNVSRKGDGSVNYNGRKLRIGLAPVMGPDAGSSVIETENLFKRAGYKTKMYRDYLPMIWTKLYLANMINFSAIEHRLPPKQAFNNQEIFDREINAMVDRLKILHAAGIDLVNLPGLPGGLVDAGLSLPFTPGLIRHLKSQLANWLDKERNGTLPAAARDMAAGRPTEARFYLEPWINLGKRVGLRSPLDEHLLEVVNEYEKNLHPPSES